MMKKFFLFFSLSLLSIGCNKSGNNCSSSTELEMSETSTDCTFPMVPEQIEGINSAIESASGLPDEAFTFDTNVSFINMILSQEEKFSLALELIKKVIATEDFRSKVFNHSYNGIKTFVDNRGFSNAQIYQMILDGAETLKPIKNNIMDMGIETYYAPTTTIGYTYSNSTQIWVNTKYFNTNTVAQVASNLMHEWLHKLGFRHAVYYSISRDYSVPYAIGRIVGSLGRQFE